MDANIYSFVREKVHVLNVVGELRGEVVSGLREVDLGRWGHISILDMVRNIEIRWGLLVMLRTILLVEGGELVDGDAHRYIGLLVEGLGMFLRHVIIDYTLDKEN